MSPPPALYHQLSSPNERRMRIGTFGDGHFKIRRLRHNNTRGPLTIHIRRFDASERIPTFTSLFTKNTSNIAFQPFVNTRIIEDNHSTGGEI